MLIFSDKLTVSSDDKEYIHKSLPTNWSTDVLEVHPEKDFEIYIRINAKTQEELLNWIASYQERTNTSYSVETTHKCSGQRLVFKRSYHCQHKTKHKSTYDPMYRKSIKNTNCPAVLIVSIRTIKKRFQGKDKSKAPDENKPCEIRMKLKHNHSTDNHMAMRFKKVLPTVKQELIRLYNVGHTASTGLQSIKADIKLNYENYEEVLADRSKCPDYPYCHYVFQKTINADNSVQFNNDFLEAKLKTYNESLDFEASRMVFTENGFVICICPPLVHRIHQSHVNSSEIVFLDSFSTCEKNTARVFVLLTQSEFGGLPLGIIIVNNNSKNDILVGFNTLKDMLGYLTDPPIMISDEYFVDNELVNEIWPETVNLLSVFHVLQKIYKWVQVTKNGISNRDKTILIKDLHNLIYSTSEQDLIEKFEFAKKNSTKYLNYLKLLQTYWDRRQLWAQCFRPNISQFKSNYSEYILRTLREKIFQGIKSFTVIQMVDFIINKYYPYFEQHLQDIALNRPIRNVFFSKQYLLDEDILKRIQILGTNIRLVPSSEINELYYMVNSDLLTCTCFTGSSNTLCYHLKCVATLIYQENVEKFAKKSQIRKNCHYLATGQHLDIPDCLDNVQIIPTPTKEETCQQIPQIIEDSVVTMETQEINEDLSIVNQTNVQKINDKIEELLQKDPENLLPALQIIYSRFRAVTNISDICTVFSMQENTK